MSFFEPNYQMGSTEFRNSAFPALSPHVHVSTIKLYCWSFELVSLHPVYNVFQQLRIGNFQHTIQLFSFCSRSNLHYKFLQYSDLTLSILLRIQFKIQFIDAFKRISDTEYTLRFFFHFHLWTKQLFSLLKLRWSILCSCAIIHEPGDPSMRLFSYFN